MRVTIALAIILVLLPAAHGSGCTMTTSDPEIDTGFVIQMSPRYYIDNDPHFEWVSVAIYEESNGIPGLQRADEVVDDTCGGTAGVGDTMIF